MNKSEELAKLLGIEPKQKDCPHRGCRNHVTHPCEVCNNKRFILVYPDFTNPNNFVKLLELYIYYIYIVQLNFNEVYCEYNLRKTDVVNDFIDWLIFNIDDIERNAECLVKKSGCFIAMFNRFRYQAQQTNWTY